MRPMAVSDFPTPGSPRIITPRPATSTVVAYSRTVGAESVSSTNVLAWIRLRVSSGEARIVPPACRAMSLISSETPIPAANTMQ